MRKWLVLCIILACVLRVPVADWEKLSEANRDKVRAITTLNYCQEQAKTGEHKWRIWETIKNGFWQLHIEEVKTII